MTNNIDIGTPLIPFWPQERHKIKQTVNSDNRRRILIKTAYLMRHTHHTRATIWVTANQKRLKERAVNYDLVTELVNESRSNMKNHLKIAEIECDNNGHVCCSKMTKYCNISHMIYFRRITIWPKYEGRTGFYQHLILENQSPDFRLLRGTDETTLWRYARCNEWVSNANNRRRNRSSIVRRITEDQSCIILEENFSSSSTLKGCWQRLSIWTYTARYKRC